MSLNSMVRWLGCLALVLAGLGGGARAVGLEAKLSVDRETIEAGETFALRISVEGTQQSSAPALPKIPGVQARYRGPSSQMEMINGQMSVRVVHEYAMIPETTNDVVIPPIPVRVGTQTLKTEGARVRVLPYEGHDEPVWLKLVVARDEVVVGETFPVELHLYFQSIRDPTAPRFDLDGFVVGRSVSPVQAVTYRRGQSWSVVVWRFAVTATKPGTLKVGPAEVDLTLLTVVPGQRRPNSPFDDFFGPQREAKRVTVKSREHPLKVMAPPSMGRPGGYSGAVGKFRFNGSVNPKTVAAGDPVTVRLTIEGEGNLEGLDFPEWPDDPSFRVYPGTNGFVASDALGLKGARTMEYVVVPERPGKLALPVPPLVAYDPQARRYETVPGPSLALEVTPGRAAGGVAGAGRDERGGTNAVAAGSAPGLEWRRMRRAVVFGGVGWGGSPWVAAGVAAPWLVWLGMAGVSVLRKRWASRPEGPVGERWLAESRAILAREAAGDVSEELALLSRAMRCRLGAWLERTPEGIGSEVVECELRPRGMDPAVCEAVAGWFARHDRLRFSRGVAVDLGSFRAETAEVIRRLDEATGRAG